MKLLQNTRMTVKTLVCSLCCWLQSARSDETDLKITNPEIKFVFSHVFLLYLQPPTTDSATFSIVFSAKRVQLKKKKEGWDDFQEVKHRKTADLKNPKKVVMLL